MPILELLYRLRRSAAGLVQDQYSLPGRLPRAHRCRQLHRPDLAGPLRRGLRAQPPLATSCPACSAAPARGPASRSAAATRSMASRSRSAGSSAPRTTIASIATCPSGPQITKDKKVAVIGAGSAGVACARELAEMGYPVTIYDMYAAPGGMMVGGIPVWRLPREVTHEEMRRVSRCARRRGQAQHAPSARTCS